MVEHLLWRAQRSRNIPSRGDALGALSFTSDRERTFAGKPSTSSARGHLSSRQEPRGHDSSAEVELSERHSHRHSRLEIRISPEE